jgi:membrane-bound metal-dependent hydrolase YbcI (DUF457 family)
VRAQTHILFALFIGIIADLLFDLKGNLLVFFAVLLFCSLLPDIDYGKSTLGKHTKLIGLLVGHRGIFHSLFALAGWTVLAVLLGFQLWIPVLIGYGSHLLIDAANTAGIQFLYPFGKKVRGSVKNGSVGEWVIFFVLLMADGLMLYVVYV